MAMQRRKPDEIRRWDPFREFREMERRFDDVFGWPMWRRRPSEDEWAPAIDMYEKGDRFIVNVELPGMSMQDIDISVTENTLIIQGDKKTEQEIKEGNYYRSERTYGHFMRSIPLPANVDTERIDASYENGVLEVGIPKTTEAKAKKIQITEKKSK